MQQSSIDHVSANRAQPREQHAEHQLGPFLCWAVVFADIGTSIYYVPGILYGTVGKLAGFFVFLTITVFILLTLKYVEVTYRFPQGGGVVTVAAKALNRWFGALGGMFILVDYFLTAAISCLSGMLYLSLVVPALGPGTTFLGLSITLWVTLVVLVLLGILNWVGVSESAKVSMVGAIIAFISDIAILVTVFSHISFSQFLGLVPSMFTGHALTPITILVGFAGSFLAFSGLESISQLSPVMKLPRSVVGKTALFLVILTVGLTSPLLTMLSTLLLPRAAADPVLSAQLISLLAGRWGGAFLQTEVAISASALLVFASNTAIIGSYHVFLALSRMEFFPAFILQRNKLRGTPHYSILLATLIPIVVLLLVQGNINILGDMYAFGLLGAFALTCVGMDIVRYRDRQARRSQPPSSSHARQPIASPIGQESSSGEGAALAHLDGPATRPYLPEETALSSEIPEPPGRWTRSTLNFWLGILTTLLVVTAWSTNLIAKPLATAFGGSVTVIGLAIAYTCYTLHRRKGRLPVITTGVEKNFPGAVLAVLTAASTSNEAVIEAAVHNTDKKPIVFLYLGQYTSDLKPRLFRLIEPHLNDPQARHILGRANLLADQAKIACRFVYRRQSPDAVYHVWQALHPADTIVDAEQASILKRIQPDRTLTEVTPQGEVVHVLKESAATT
jgi:amino acid transporter